MSKNGMRTSFWGPHAWAFLFSSIAGSYPVKIDESNKEHIKIVKAYRDMLHSLQYTLPCVYCRESYRRFIKEIPLSKYNHSRNSMMKWLYLIHDKVNNKLITCEVDEFNTKKEIIIKKKPHPDKLYDLLKKLKKNVMKTKPSPPFEQVLAKYERHRV